MTTKYTLFMKIESDDQELINEYNTRVVNHNNSMETNTHPDSGFDILLPEKQRLVSGKGNFVDFKLKCCMKKNVRDLESNVEEVCTGFYLYPRSSISKTPARLSNCVGIIDSGYRGNLGGYFDIVNGHELFEPCKLSRLAQICAPSLEPFNVIIVQDVEELGSTLRGTGGFGSTGN